MAPELAVSPWRHLALIAAILLATHLFVHGAAGALTVEGALRRSPTSLVPVSAMFLTWPIIAVGLVGYGFYALATDQRPLGIHDQVTRHVVAVALLASLQLVTLERAQPVLDAGIALALAAVASSAYRRIQVGLVAQDARARYGREVARSTGALFALLAGFTTMTALGFTDAAITSAGCPSGAPALALLAAATAFALRAGLGLRDPVVPTFASAALASIVAAHPTAPAASLVVFGAGLCGALAIFLAAVQLAAHRQRSPRSARPVHIHHIVQRPRI